MKTKNIFVVFLSALVFTMAARAADFDVSKPLLCASIDVFECIPGGECTKVTAESINAPQFLMVDVNGKSLTAAQASQEKRSTVIKDIRDLGDKLMLQGIEGTTKVAESGIGWSMAINKAAGQMVLTASAEDAAFVIFGACTVLPGDKPSSPANKQ